MQFGRDQAIVKSDYKIPLIDVKAWVHWEVEDHAFSVDPDQDPRHDMNMNIDSSISVILKLLKIQYMRMPIYILYYYKLYKLINKIYFFKII